ncbi:MAG: hypothetical protein ACTHKK_05020 [Candidatus Nitrosocosmicus sp.]
MDIKEILYAEIDKIGGKDVIRTQLSDDISNSKLIINALLDKCAVLLNKDNQTEDEFAMFGEALLHFLLTMAMIPAERKIVVDNIDIDILIPNSKNLKTDNEKALIIHFNKNKKENIDDVIKKISQVQKNKNNIWFVSSKGSEYGLNTFIVSSDSSLSVNDHIKRPNYPFSEILIKIDEFLKHINYTGLKIF